MRTPLSVIAAVSMAVAVGCEDDEPVPFTKDELAAIAKIAKAAKAREDRERLPYVQQKTEVRPKGETYSVLLEMSDDSPTEPRDDPKMRMVFSEACHSGMFNGCYNLGVMFERGLGDSKNPQGARKSYERACKGDVMQACHNLAVFLHDGRGGAKDVAAARTHYQKACDARRTCTGQFGLILVERS